jgi:hypothetical protein
MRTRFRHARERRGACEGILGRVSTGMSTSPGNTVFDIDATTLVRRVCTVVVASAALGVGACGDGGTDPAEIRLSIQSATSLPAGQVDVAYSETLEATGGDGTYLWGIASGSLPAGLSLNADTGVISGTPTAAETTNFEVEVTSGGQTSTGALQITIGVEAPSPLSITTSSPMPNGTVGVAYSQTLTAIGGDGSYTWATLAGNPPDGLVLDGATGEISGTPTDLGTVNFEVGVMSAGQSATKVLAIIVG